MFDPIQKEDLANDRMDKSTFQLGVDIGSSTVARGVVSLVLGYLSNLVIEMAFLIQVNLTSRLLILVDWNVCWL